MAKHFPKRIVIFLVAAILGGLGSYNIGFSGINLAQVVTESRCSAGAFIAHVKAPAELKADAQSSSKSATSGVVEHDVSTTVATPVATIGSNLLPNPGAETLASGQPDSWSNNRVGSNDASFTQVAGHNSGRALRIDITKYTDGTADWFTNTIAVKPGSYYVYTDYYRSNVATPITLMLKYADGKQQYVVIGNEPLSMTWAQSSVRFFVPLGVKEILVSHTLDRIGSLETDDYSLTEATPTGFSEPLVSVTFDDGYANTHDVALPIMKRYNVVSTQYLVSGLLGAKNYVKASQVYDYVKAGHEVASHTLDHKNLTTVTDKELTREVALPKQGLEKCYGNVTDFAAPYGAYNARTTAAVKGLYGTARSTDVGFNSADLFNPYELKVQNVRADTTPQQIQDWLDTAKTNHLWLILVYHQIDNSHTEYSRSADNFESDVQKIVASGIPVKTIKDGYAEVSPQLKR